MGCLESVVLGANGAPGCGGTLACEEVTGCVGEGIGATPLALAFSSNTSEGILCRYPYPIPHPKL